MSSPALHSEFISYIVPLSQTATYTQSGAVSAEGDTMTTRYDYTQDDMDALLAFADEYIAAICADDDAYSEVHRVVDTQDDTDDMVYTTRVAVCDMADALRELATLIMAGR